MPKIAIVFALSLLTLSAAAQQVTIQTGTSLSNLINNLYGGDGIQLKPNGHQAHFGETEDFQEFTESLQKTLQSRPLFPEPSSVGVVSYKFNDETGTYERVQSSYGPILAERATTSGRKHATFGVSYTFSDFENFNGNDAIDLTLHHCLLPECVFGNPNASFLKDTIDVHVHLKLKSQAIATTVVYGLTDRVDVGLVLPYIRNDLNVFTHAHVVVFPGNDPLVHQFDPSIETPDQLAIGHAIGIGDVIARAKIQLPLRIPFQTAFLADVIIPSGDKKNFLGTGDLRLKGTFIASAAGRIAPHVNLGYEWNTTTARLSTIDYRLGTEFAATPRLTLVGDLLGIVQPSTAPQFRVRALENESLVARSQIDFGLGAKWQVGSRSLVTFNLLTPVNDSGIRPNSVITLGLQYGM